MGMPTWPGASPRVALWDRAADIVTILLSPGMPWHNIEATLQAAAPSEQAVDGDRRDDGASPADDGVR